MVCMSCTFPRQVRTCELHFNHQISSEPRPIDLRVKRVLVDRAGKVKAVYSSLWLQSMVGLFGMERYIFELFIFSRSNPPQHPTIDFLKFGLTWSSMATFNKL